MLIGTPDQVCLGTSGDLSCSVLMPPPLRGQILGSVRDITEQAIARVLTRYSTQLSLNLALRGTLILPGTPVLLTAAQGI